MFGEADALRVAPWGFSGMQKKWRDGSARHEGDDEFGQADRVSRGRNILNFLPHMPFEEWRKSSQLPLKRNMGIVVQEIETGGAVQWG